MMQLMVQAYLWIIFVMAPFNKETCFSLRLTGENSEQNHQNFQTPLKHIQACVFHKFSNTPFSTGGILGKESRGHSSRANTFLKAQILNN